MTKEFTTLSSKVSENSDISYLATITVKGKKVKKRRYFDLFDRNTKTGIESKVGNPKLTDFTKIQIQKDIASLSKKHTKKMIGTISKICEINPNQINIKGKTTEKLGLIGKEKAIASEVIASVIKYD